MTSLMKLISVSDDENLRSAAATPSLNHPLFDVVVTFYERSATGKASRLANGAIPGVESLITWAKGAKFGIMFEFSAVRSSVVTLRIGYDNSAFSADEVLVIWQIDTGLEYICQHMESPMKVRDLEDRLLHVDATVHGINRAQVGAHPSYQVNQTLGSKVSDSLNISLSLFLPGLAIERKLIMNGKIVSFFCVIW
ncbi:hypothetical protein F5B21DRAFT_436618 [Xylaria acuta]|nr:hypothetical protein F5B21DRAFT_436618 [Xylaria acuta]